MTVLSALLPIALAFIGLLPMLGILLLWRAKERRYVRESPLVRDMLRPPGYSLREKVDRINEDIDMHLLAVATIPLFVFAAHVSQSHFADQPETAFRIIISVGAGVPNQGLLYRIGRVAKDLTSRKCSI